MINRMKSARAIAAFALLVGACAATDTAVAKAPLVRTQAPGFFRWAVGNFEFTALNDGSGPAPMDILIHGATAAEVRSAYARDFLKLPTPFSRNQYLINTGSKLVLIDTGGGDDFDLHEGRLRESLPAAGYKPEQIDIVLLTHLHPDHIGGLLRDGKMAFPNAIIRVEQRELEYWLDPRNEESSVAAATEGPLDAAAIRLGFLTVRRSFAPYLAAGMVRTFHGDTPIVAGIRAVSAPGHTPGHTMYMVESNGEKLLVVGDIVHSATLQFERPDLTIAFDKDEDRARAQRLKVFGAAATNGLMIAGAHLSFPGMGYVRNQGKGYVFIPLPWKLKP